MTTEDLDLLTPPLTQSNKSNLYLLESLKGFRIASLNVASIPKYIDQLRVYMVNKPIDILCINESRLDETITNDAVGIAGYSLFRNDRYRLGGGVAVYVRNVLNVNERSSLVPLSLEAICVEVFKPKTKPILLTAIYRPPDSKIEYTDTLENYLSQLDRECSELI